MTIRHRLINLQTVCSIAAASLVCHYVLIEEHFLSWQGQCAAEMTKEACNVW